LFNFKIAFPPCTCYPASLLEMTLQCVRTQRV